MLAVSSKPIMNTQENTADFSSAIDYSIRIRKLYNELEERNHGGPWTNQEDVIGFVHDVGELGRMVMAAEGRWVYPGELREDLADKWAECLWWLFVLSDRLGIDGSAAFTSKMRELEAGLSASLKQAGK